ncbi:MAG TPA: 50S ribosomal protein L21 [Thermodesulfovibrionales bacterium]|nr:50S ribosomal protein L21 [Thermodesulfovibrionales bacterium]
MYAIIETGGRQVAVAAGDTVKVDKLSLEPGTGIQIDRVLAVVDGTKTVCGSPYVSGAEVKAEVVGTIKERKVLVYKKRPRRVYEKLRGHRQPYTVVKITEVNVGG